MSAVTSRPTACNATHPRSTTASGATSTTASTIVTTAFRTTEATRGYLIPGQHIELAALEDRESVQVALSVVINALASGNLDIKRATALLYGLQLASNNARGLRTEPFAPDVVRTIEPSPEGLDLAEPGAVVEEPTDNLTWDPVEEYDEDDEEQEQEHNHLIAKMMNLPSSSSA